MLVPLKLSERQPGYSFQPECLQGPFTRRISSLTHLAVPWALKVGDWTRPSCLEIRLLHVQRCISSKVISTEVEMEERSDQSVKRSCQNCRRASKHDSSYCYRCHHNPDPLVDNWEAGYEQLINKAIGIKEEENLPIRQSQSGLNKKQEIDFLIDLMAYLTKDTQFGVEEDELKEKCERIGIQEKRFREIIKKLMDEGECYQPRPGSYKFAYGH